MGGGAGIAQGCVPVAITVGFMSPDGALVKISAEAENISFPRFPPSKSSPLHRMLP